MMASPSCELIATRRKRFPRILRDVSRWPRAGARLVEVTFGRESLEERALKQHRESEGRPRPLWPFGVESFAGVRGKTHRRLDRRILGQAATRWDLGRRWARDLVSHKLGLKGGALLHLGDTCREGRVMLLLLCHQDTYPQLGLSGKKRRREEGLPVSK
ncbi:hypothetical protein LZ30DRAFT_739457 [Colletotrichum cereale]|nr:hypothetical protein LZ30DRAFT_739457 [Colletotrichum cereale]